MVTGGACDPFTQDMLEEQRRVTTPRPDPPYSWVEDFAASSEAADQLGLEHFAPIRLTFCERASSIRLRLKHVAALRSSSSHIGS